MSAKLGSSKMVTPPRVMTTKASWSTSPPEAQEDELLSPASSDGRAVIVSGKNVTKFSKHYNGSIRRKLRGLHSAIQNIEALAAMYTGETTKAPFDLVHKLEKVFSDSCTALTESLRKPSHEEGVQEWSHDDIFQEFKSQFEFGFQWELLRIEVYNPPKEIIYEVRATNKDTDVTFMDIAFVNDGKIDRIHRQRSIYSLEPLKNCLESYFALFNGRTEAPKNFREAFDSVYAPTARSISSKGYISCELMFESCMMLFARGAKMELTSIEAHERGISYTVSCKGRGLDFTSQSMAMVEQGRVVRVEACRKKKYTTKRNLGSDEEKTTQEAIDNIKSLFTMFNGVRKVPPEFYEVFSEVYDPAVEADIPSFESGEEFEDLNFFELQEEVVTVFRRGMVMELVEIERKAPGKVLYTVRAYNSSTLMIFRTLVRVKSGKVYRVTRKGTHFSILPLMKAFREYANLFLGEKLYPEDWKDRLDAIVNQTEISIETGAMSIGYDTVCSSMERYLRKQGKLRVNSLSRHKRGLLYELEYQLKDQKPERVKALAIVAWGRIVRIKVLKNGKFYDKLYGEFMEQDDTEATDRSADKTDAV